MFGTYLRRELGNRTRQTVIVAIGMALAIALVLVVSAISSGVRDAQAAVLDSIYGVGTDITVTETPQPPEEGEAGGPLFEFDSEDGVADDETDSTSLEQSRLVAGPFGGTFDASALDTIGAIDGVEAASATLSLDNITFTGEIPQFGDVVVRPAPGDDGGPSGGSDGAGGSAFDVDSFSVEGVDVGAASVGPLTSVTLDDGRGLDSSDTGARVAVLDSAYATSEELAVGDTIAVGGEDFEVVGIISSASADATTPANVYIPLDVAQELSGLEDQVSTAYVQATDASQVAALADALADALPDATVSTQEDLASDVSGSLSTAADLVGNLGTWLSAIVLAAAFLLAILFTISGVARRTREFGTLKAIGWSNGRIVRQVAGESLVQGLIGGAAGIALGLAGVWAVNAIAPTLSASTGGFGGLRPDAGGPVSSEGGGPLVVQGGPAGALEGSTTDIVLTASIGASVLLLAVGLAILGGLLAGAIGGWRAARLRPAEALRSVA
jgi:ABC-type antimicrobial peptide transport system permease subunit